MHESVINYNMHYIVLFLNSVICREQFLRDLTAAHTTNHSFVFVAIVPIARCRPGPKNRH